MKRIALLAVLCASCVATPQQAESPTAATSATLPRSSAVTGSTVGPLPSAAVALAGRTIAARVAFDNPSFYLDGSSLVATWVRSGPSPFLSRVVIAVPPANDWQTVYESDAIFQGSVAAGRVALVEYREQSGGAQTDDVMLIDLANGRRTPIDHFELSSATFHGGGGGPPHPVGRVVLGSRRVAWVHVVEGSAGSTTGELRIATLDDPTRSLVVASSGVLIRPITIDDTTLVYEAALGTAFMEIRARDLATGRERILAGGPISEIDGPPFASVTSTGDHVVWTQLTRDTHEVVTGAELRLVSIRDGTTRRVPIDGTCTNVTANARFVALNCYAPVDASGAKPAMKLFDVAALTAVPTAPVGRDGPHDLIAIGTSELAWQRTVSGDPQIVVLFPN